MGRLKFLIYSVFFTLNYGCVTVESISVSPIPATKDRKNKISAERSRPVIFGIPFGTGFVDEARQDLLDKCTKGDIDAVVSKHETASYPFFRIVTLRLEGYCILASGSQADLKKKKR